MAGRPYAQTDQPVFVTDSAARRRVLVAAGVAVALVAALWLVALALSISGLGELGRLDLPGIPDNRKKSPVPAQSPAPGPAQALSAAGESEAETAAPALQVRARTPGRKEGAARSPDRRSPAPAGLVGTGLPAPSITTPVTAPTPTRGRPADTPAPTGTSSPGQGTSKVTPGDAHSEAAPGQQTAPGIERRALADPLPPAP